MQLNNEEHNSTGGETTFPNTSQNTIPEVDNLHIIFYLCIGKYAIEMLQLILLKPVGTIKGASKQARLYLNNPYQKSSHLWLICK